LIGAYSVAVLKDGSKSYEVMSIEEIRALRDRSQAWKAFKANKIKSTPWSTDEAEMARKTVAKRHAKQLPSSADLDDLIRRDDHLYQEGSDDKPSNATAISARPSGAAALDQFAARVEPAPVPAEPSEPAEPESDGVTVPDAMALGGQARRDGKRKLVPPDVAQLGDAFGDAWRAGWDDADAEIAAAKS
jgi:recombination protein RecT